MPFSLPNFLALKLPLPINSWKLHLNNSYHTFNFFLYGCQLYHELLSFNHEMLKIEVESKNKFSKLFFSFH